MAILKSNNSGRGVMLGTYVENKDAFFLALYCVANGITKTSVFKELISAKLKELKENNSEEDLITMVVRIGKRALKTSKKSEDAFYEELKEELTKKGISYDVVDTIIEQVKDGGKEKDSRKRR